MGALDPPGPTNPLKATHGRALRVRMQPFPRKQQPEGESRALAPPSTSSAECLDNWMEYLAGRVLPGSLSSDFKRRGQRGCWLQKEAQEVICGLGGPLPRPDQYRCPPSPLCGGELESGPWGKDRTEGGGSRMVSEVCWGQSGEVRLRGQFGLKEWPGRDSVLIS